jgi:hypothetical protein
MDNMVYAIKRIMEQERVDSKKEEKIEIAREMLREKDSIDKISRITKLPLATIQELAQSMQQQ